MLHQDNEKTDMFKLNFFRIKNMEMEDTEEEVDAVQECAKEGLSRLLTATSPSLSDSPGLKSTPKILQNEIAITGPLFSQIQLPSITGPFVSQMWLPTSPCGVQMHAHSPSPNVQGQSDVVLPNLLHSKHHKLEQPSSNAQSSCQYKEKSAQQARQSNWSCELNRCKERGVETRYITILGNGPN
jgi:hypothetical protein